MKKEELFSAIGDADDEMVASARKPETKIRWLKPALVAACLCLVITGGVIYKLENRYPVREMPGGNTETGEEIYEIEHWEDLPIYSQYQTVYVNGTEYSVTSGKLSPDKAGGKICEAVALGWDEYADIAGEDGSKQCGVEVFALKGVLEDCGVAVKYAENGEYYSAVNWRYRPETLGQFIDDINMRENVVFTHAWYEYKKPVSGDLALIRFDDVDAERIWDILLSEAEAENVFDNCDTDYHATVIDIGVDVPVFGYKNISLSVCDDGYIRTNIMDTGKMFFIGEDKTQEFIDYVLKECKGYEVRLSTAVTAVPE